jgi:hypothetical protein
VLKKSKNPSYELSEFNEKGISSYTENGVTVFIVKSDDEWSVEMNLPYCVGFYLDRNGDILGTTGHAHRLLEEAIKTAHQHCTGNSQWGWLSPEGKFYRRSHSQHSVVAEYLFPDSNANELLLHEKGYIIRRWGGFEVPLVTRSDWGDPVDCPSNKQQLAIIDWCKKYNEPMPDFMKEFV